MSRFNYNALLQYLNISHGQFVFVLIILFLISSFVYFLYKLGFLTKIKFKQHMFPQSHLLYISYKGNYDLIQKAFNKVMQDINAVLKLSQPFGIYYDNPKQIQNPDQSRAVLGCVVNKNQYDKICMFLKRFPQYRQSKIEKQTSCLGTTYPFFNALSMILVITRVYPKLAQQVKTRKIQNTVGILQIYKLINERKQEIQVLLPLENLSQFQLWYEPETINQIFEQKQTKQQ